MRRSARSARRARSYHFAKLPYERGYYVLRKPLWRPRRPRTGCGAGLFERPTTTPAPPCVVSECRGAPTYGAVCHIYLPFPTTTRTRELKTRDHLAPSSPWYGLQTG